MWCGFFPYMDTGHFVCSDKDQSNMVENFNKAAKLLHSMQKQLKLAGTWCKISEEYARTLVKARKHWKCAVDSPGSGPADNNDRGLAIYKAVEMKLKSFNPQPDASTANPESPLNLTDILQALRNNLERTSSSTKDNLKSEGNTTADGETKPGITPQQHPANASNFIALNRGGK